MLESLSGGKWPPTLLAGVSYCPLRGGLCPHPEYVGKWAGGGFISDMCYRDRVSVPRALGITSLHLPLYSGVAQRRGKAPARQRVAHPPLPISERSSPPKSYSQP